MRVERTQVVIVGAGPAGALLSQLLRVRGVQSVVLEHRPRAHVLARIRAGVLEHGSAETLRQLGLGARMAREGHVHEGVELAFRGERFRIDFVEHAGVPVLIYGQTEVQKDLYAACDAHGTALLDEALDVRLHGLTTATPHVTFTRHGEARRIDCDYVVGCDGYHGVSRASIPPEKLTVYEREYPFGWLGILSETPPVSDELIYANHTRGFALCSMRNPHLSRYYVQCDVDARVQDWSDARFWDELKARLPGDVAARLVTGPSIEKSIAPLRSFVSEPMQYGRLFLAGDASHIVPPTGAKGLNLAISDVVCLAEALEAHYARGDDAQLEGYSQRALHRVWRAVRFSWWMTTLMHRLPEGGAFSQRIQEAELSLLRDAPAAQEALARQYTGVL
ncbi:MAG: 4-hydroxybenzoate 3-monooxygenase [Polyangiales bacterium]